jgi:hypothetical protein
LGLIVGGTGPSLAGSSFYEPNLWTRGPVKGISLQSPLAPSWKASEPESDGRTAIRSLQWINEGATDISVTIKASQSGWCDGLDTYPITFALKAHEHKLISLRYPQETLERFPSYRSVPIYLDWQFSAPGLPAIKGSAGIGLPTLEFFVYRKSSRAPVVSTFIDQDETKRSFELRHLRISRKNVPIWSGEGPWKSAPGHGLTIVIEGLTITPGDAEISAEYRQSPNLLWRPVRIVKHIDLDRLVKPVDIPSRQEKQLPVTKFPADTNTQKKVEKSRKEEKPSAKEQATKADDPLRVVLHVQLSKDTEADLLAAEGGSVYVVDIVRSGRELGRIDVRRMLKDDFENCRIPSSQNYAHIMEIVRSFPALDGHIQEVVPTPDGCLVDVGLFPKTESWPVVRADLIFRWRTNSPNELELFDANQGGQPASVKPKRLPRIRGEQYLVSNDSVYWLKGAALVKTPIAVLPPYISGEPKPWLVYGMDGRQLLLKRYSPVQFAGGDSYDRMAVDLVTHKVSVLPSLSTPDP